MGCAQLTLMLLGAPPRFWSRGPLQPIAIATVWPLAFAVILWSIWQGESYESYLFVTWSPWPADGAVDAARAAAARCDRRPPSCCWYWPSSLSVRMKTRADLPSPRVWRPGQGSRTIVRDGAPVR